MAGIEILIDARSFERAADEHAAREILPRMVRALNDVAAAAKADVVDAIRGELDNPSPFTAGGVAIFKVKPSPTRDPDAVVFIRDKQAEYPRPTSSMARRSRSSSDQARPWPWSCGSFRSPIGSP